VKEFHSNNPDCGFSIEDIIANKDYVVFFDQFDSVLNIDRALLKPHHWRGPQNFSSLCNPKAPGPFTISIIHGNFELGRNMWGGSGLGAIVDEAVGTEYMIKAVSFLSHALDEFEKHAVKNRQAEILDREEAEKHAVKMRQEEIRDREEWEENRRNYLAHCKFADVNSFPPVDVSKIIF